jgi:rhodanese-related sulfurtransferase
MNRTLIRKRFVAVSAAVALLAGMGFIAAWTAGSIAEGACGACGEGTAPAMHSHAEKGEAACACAGGETCVCPEGECACMTLTEAERKAKEKVEAAGVGYLTARQLQMRTRQGRPPIVVDVLGASSYTARRLKGAINIPVGRIKDLAPQVLPDKSAEIVVYCGSYKCGASLTAAKALKDMGYTNVHDYKGGIQEWAEQGLPIEGTTAQAD